MVWGRRRLLPAAAVTTHAKPHERQQLARDLEVERAVMAQWLLLQRFSEVQRSSSSATSMAGFLLNCSFPAVQPQKSRVRACDQPVRKFKDGLGISKLSLLSGQSDILLPVQQYRHGVESPPRGSRSSSTYSCLAARTAATCEGYRGEARCHGAALPTSKFRRRALRQFFSWFSAELQLSYCTATKNAVSELATSLSGNPKIVWALV